MSSSKSINKFILLYIFIFLYTIFVGQAKSAWAGSSHDLIAERAWLIDHGGLMTWEEVQQSKDWRIKKDSPVISAGYGKGAVWFRLRIDPTSTDLPPEAKLVMRIRPAYLDQLQLFDPLQTPAMRPMIGDTHPKPNSVDPSSSLSYSLPAGSSSREVWVRLETSSTRMAHVDVMDEQSMRKSNKKIEHLGALYLSTIFMFVVWGLIQLTVQKERLALIFILYQISALLFGFCLFGYASLYLPNWLEPSAINFMTSFLGITSTFLVSVFAQQVLGDLRKYFWRVLISFPVHLIFAICFFMIIFGEVRIGLQINMSLIFILPIFHFAIALLTPRKMFKERQHPIPQWINITYFSITLVITLLTSMPALNLVPATELSHYIVSFYSVCSGFLMMMVIHYRGIQNIKDHTALTAKADQAEQEALKERLFRQETEQLLTMLGHELKTPLATLLLQVNDPQLSVNLSKKLTKSVADMSNVIERTIQIGQVNHRTIEVQLMDCDLPDLLKGLIESMQNPERMTLQILNLHARKINTDIYLLTIIIRNLLDNALKYGESNSNIVVTLNQAMTSTNWVIGVANRPGRAGWPDAEKVFEKYYRSPAATYRSGTGLGLFLVKSLAEKFNYSVNYCPTEDLIVFTLTITPCRQD
jgi:two-component system, sensor histidine kinase LadS